MRILGHALVIAVSLAPARPSPAVAAEAGTAASAPAPHAAAFESDIKAFELTDRTLRSPTPRIVFMGSSSIRMWDTLAKDFPQHRVVNRGFGGSYIADSTYFADRILAPHKSALIFMYAGANDVDHGNTPQTVAADFKAFAAKVWSSSPGTVIAFISIAPNPARWHQVDGVRKANKLIAAYCETDPRLKFIDVFSLMLGADGKPRPELFMEDGLHMSRKGYDLWIPPVRASWTRSTSPPPRPRRSDRAAPLSPSPACGRGSG
jgi:lysophospholipase L1-like esterase